MIQTPVYRALGVGFVLLTLAPLFVIVPSAIMSDHWKTQINSCILYGANNNGRFVGGTMSNCEFVTYTPIVFMIAALILACLCIYKGFVAPPSETEIQGSVIPMAMVLTALLGMLFSLIVACVLTVGSNMSCKEYRAVAVEELRKNSSCIENKPEMEDLINNRLPCDVMYDFLDFLGSNGASINTYACVQVAKGGAWTTFIMWFLVMCYVGFMVKDAIRGIF